VIRNKYRIDFDFDAFESEVYGAARVKFTGLHRGMSSDTFYSFNFCTADAYIVVFTQEGLENTVRRERQYTNAIGSYRMKTLRTIFAMRRNRLIS